MDSRTSSPVAPARVSVADLTGLPRRVSRRQALGRVATAGAGLLAAGCGASAAPLLTIDAIRISPERPGPDTLCSLTVQLTNHGDRAASRFVFDVAIGGTRAAWHRSAMHFVVVAAGRSAELRVTRFWSTESARPRPASFDLEVALVEAAWTAMRTDDDGVATWSALEPVPSLPLRRSLRVAVTPA